MTIASVRQESAGRSAVVGAQLMGVWALYDKLASCLYGEGAWRALVRPFCIWLTENGMSNICQARQTRQMQGKWQADMHGPQSLPVESQSSSWEGVSDVRSMRHLGKARWDNVLPYWNYFPTTTAWRLGFQPQATWRSRPRAGPSTTVFRTSWQWTPCLTLMLSWKQGYRENRILHSSSLVGRRQNGNGDVPRYTVTWRWQLEGLRINPGNVHLIVHREASKNTVRTSIINGNDFFSINIHIHSTSTSKEGPGT